MIAINYQKETSHIKEKHLTKKELSHKVLSFVGVAFCDLLFICLGERFVLLGVIELVTPFLYV